jgi:AhpD family alkylhydroperoxidase
MMGYWSDVSARLSEPSKALKAANPGPWAGFAELHKEAMKDGELSAALKEVIALVISTVDECEGCIAAHARGAARKGATKEQVAEALGVVMLMRGGPATIYGPKAYEAFLEFKEPQA